MKIDCLHCLDDIVGKDCFNYRNMLYTVLSGDNHDCDLNKAFGFLYGNFKDFTCYVNDKYHYGDDTIPIIERCVMPLRSTVDNYKKKMYQSLCDTGGKYLVETHDILYFAYMDTAVLPSIEEMEVIC